MKLLEHVKQSRYVLLFTLLTLLICACETQNEQVVPLEPELEESCIEFPKTPFGLTGETIFSVFSIKRKFYIYPPTPFITTGTLTHKKGHSYLFHMESYLPGESEPFRIVDFDARIMPGGTMIMSWPDEWWEFGAVYQGSVVDQMMEHTGYKFRGPGIKGGTTVYTGKFDGSKLKLTSSLMAKQVQPGTFPQYQEMVDGPINMKIVINLNVNQSHLANIN